MINRSIKVKDIIIVAVSILLCYIAIDNYMIFFNIVSKFFSTISPFIYALLFAYVLNPVMKLLENKFKLKRGIAISITYIFIAGVIAVCAIFIIPSVIKSIISITSEMPNYITIAEGWITSTVENKDIYDVINSTGILQHITELSKNMGTIAINFLQGSLSSIVQFTTDVVKIGFGLLVAIYVLLDKESLLKGAKAILYMMLKEEKGDTVCYWLSTLNKMIGAYVGTKALDSLIIGVLALIGLLIFKAPYAILLAIIVGFTNMIPYFGPFIGELVGGIIGIFVSTSMAIKIVVFLLLLQQFDAWYLEPKLVGKKVGVKPFFIIIGVMIGGAFFGALGMLLASPIMATLNLMFEKRVEILKVMNKNLFRKIEAKDKPEENKQK